MHPKMVNTNQKLTVTTPNGLSAAVHCDQRERKTMKTWKAEYHIYDWRTTNLYEYDHKPIIRIIVEFNAFILLIKVNLFYLDILCRDF